MDRLLLFPSWYKNRYVLFIPQTAEYQVICQSEYGLGLVGKNRQGDKSIVRSIGLRQDLNVKDDSVPFPCRMPFKCYTAGEKNRTKMYIVLIFFCSLRRQEGF